MFHTIRKYPEPEIPNDAGMSGLAILQARSTSYCVAEPFAGESQRNQESTLKE